VLDRAPALAREEMKQGLAQILQAASPEQAHERFEELRERLSGEADAAHTTLESGVNDATAVPALPEKYRCRLRTTNMLERLIEEIRRRVKMIHIFPDLASAERLIGALCAEMHEEWSTGRRYLIMDAFYDWKRAQAPESTSAESSSSESSEPTSSEPTTESPAAVAA
jgi:transposase-like protein